LLSEYFPARIRYSSLSIPYHIGTGYFGGFLPLVSQYIVARTGNPYAGLWYMLAIVALALVTCLVGLVTVLCRSPISLSHLGFEGERADAAQI
jgi:hypothetical protein